MAMKWIWCLVVALLWVGLVGHSGAATKIQHFTDDQGTLHICNDQADSGEKAKELKAGMQRRQWVYPATAPPLPPSPLSGQLTPEPLPVAPYPPVVVAPPAPVVPPTPEEAARDEAVRGVQEETTPEAEATPNVVDFGRFRGGGGRR